jgi:hypothetical protein
MEIFCVERDLGKRSIVSDMNIFRDKMWVSRVFVVQTATARRPSSVMVPPTNQEQSFNRTTHHPRTSQKVS